jgi:hypothetical protein
MLKQEYDELKSDNRDEERRNGPEFDNLQFRVVEDMAVLREVRNYLMKRVGAITEHHVSFWKACRMYDIDTPLSAYARLKEEANALAEFNPTFRADVEIWKLITRADLPGVNFFPKHLFDAMDLTMRTKKHDYDSNDPDYYIQISDLWAQLAQEEWNDMPGNNAPKYAQLRAELKLRGVAPNWDSADKQAIQPAGVAKTGTGAVANPTGLTCSYCKRNCHVVAECRKKKADLARKSEEQRATVATVTPGAHTGTEDRVHKPGSALARQTQQQGGAGPRQQQQPPVCDVCTGLNNGQEVRHFVKFRCALADQTKAPPPNLNMSQPRLRVVLDKMRANHGMHELPPWQPRQPGPRVAAVISVAPPTGIRIHQLSEAAEPWHGAPVMMPVQPRIMYSAAHARTASAGRAMEKAVAFHASAKEFICIECTVPCTVTFGLHGTPARVVCTKCSKVFYETTQIPQRWRTTAVWHTTAEQMAQPTNVSRVFGSSVSVEGGHPEVRAPIRHPDSKQALLWKLHHVYRRVMSAQAVNGDADAQREFESLLTQVDPITASSYRDKAHEHGIVLSAPALQIGWRQEAELSRDRLTFDTPDHSSAGTTPEKIRLPPRRFSHHELTQQLIANKVHPDDIKSGPR